MESNKKANPNVKKTRLCQFKNNIHQIISLVSQNIKFIKNENRNY